MMDQDPEKVVVTGEMREADYETAFVKLAQSIESLIAEFRLSNGIGSGAGTEDIGAFKRLGDGENVVDVRSSHAHQVKITTSYGVYEVDMSKKDVVMQHRDEEGEDSPITDDETGVSQLRYIAGTVARAKLANLHPER